MSYSDFGATSSPQSPSATDSTDPSVDAKQAAASPEAISEYIMSVCRLATVVSDFNGFAQNKVTSSEWFALQTLKSSGPVTTSVLSKRMMVSRQRLGKALKRLAGKGLVESTTLPNDKRSTQVTLTDKGAETLSTLSGGLQAAVQGFTSDKVFGSLSKATRVNSRLIAHMKSSKTKAANAGAEPEPPATV
jgi:DNA-binding MarR family transcriptional regulator